VRGLSSNRACARQGFFSAFVTLLKQMPEGSEKENADIVDEARKIVTDNASTGGSKGEDGDFLCGQLLCGGALLRWGRLTPEQSAAVVADVLEVAKKRSYLTVTGVQFVVDYISRVS
jgi:hypothetical protein